MIPKWLLLHWRLVLVSVVFSAILTPFALNIYVNSVTSHLRHTKLNQVPSKRIAIVLGAGVYADGRPTPMLADRVKAAVDLYKQGKVKKLLMTGDNSSQNYNEVGAMRRYAISRGVPDKDITLDHAGFSTYESCYRAQKIFGVQQAVIITQQFHLPRAVYLCNQFDINSVGLGTPDWGSYTDRTVRYYYFREFLSTIKALWQVHITNPAPTFLGKFEGMK